MINIGVAQLEEQESPKLWCRKTCVGSIPTTYANLTLKKTLTWLLVGYHVLRRSGKSPSSTNFSWGHMFQRLGENALQAICGEFDSHWLH